MARSVLGAVTATREAGDLEPRLSHVPAGVLKLDVAGKQLRVAGQGRALPPCKLSVAATEAGTWSRQNLRGRCGSCGGSPAILSRSLRASPVL